MHNHFARQSLKAFAALAEGRYADAASAWRHLLDLERLPVSLRAAALNNAAAAHLIIGDYAQSRALLQLASDANTLLRAEAASDQLRGTSSSFHFRLAAKLPVQFASAANARREHIASAIAAIIDHHVALAASGDKRAEAEAPLQTACGRTSVEASLLRAGQRSQIAAGYRSRFMRLTQALGMPVKNERQELELALAAIAILPPVVVGAVSTRTDVLAQGLQ